LSIIGKVAVFQDLPPPVFGRLERTGRPVTPRKGSCVAEQGDAADAVFGIVGSDRRLRIGSAGRRSKRLTVMVLAAGDIFGEMGVRDEAVLRDLPSPGGRDDRDAGGSGIGTPVSRPALARPGPRGRSICARGSQLPPL
jgi:CRP-like cAMP-binding protein